MDRMYPYGCKGETSATLSLSKGGRQIKQVSVKSMNGYGFMHFENLQQSDDDYSITVSNLRWGRDAVPDFTVSVYSRDPVTLVCDKSGEKGKVYSNGKKIRDANPDNRRDRNLKSDSSESEKDDDVTSD